MYKENGFTYQLLILIIIIIIAIAGVIINKIVGRNGMIDRAVEVEEEYGREDIVEKINYIVMQKFIELNNQAKSNNQNIAELYNADVVIEHLKQTFIIEEMYNEDGEFNNIYKINIDKLQDKADKYYGVFQLEKIEDKYMIVYYDENDNSKEIGELKIQQV